MDFSAVFQIPPLKRSQHAIYIILILIKPFSESSIHLFYSRHCHKAFLQKSKDSKISIKQTRGNSRDNIWK